MSFQIGRDLCPGSLEAISYLNEGNNGPMLQWPLLMGSFEGGGALTFKVAACTPECIFKEKIYIIKGCFEEL